MMTTTTTSPSISPFKNKTATKATLLRLLSYLQTPQVPRTSSFTNNWTGRFLVPFFTAFSAPVELRRIARAGRDITERVRARIACAPSQLRRKFETLSLLAGIAMSVTTSKLPFSRSEGARQTQLGLADDDATKL